MPLIVSAHNDVIHRSLRVPEYTDLVELDSAEPQTYTVPSTANMILINPVKQSDGSSTTVYCVPGTNAIGSAITGSAFGNQPANDGVEIVSSSAADTTQSITIWYTRNGAGDTVSSETKALNGTSQVALTDTDVQLVLGVELSAVCAGTVTVREASGNATITTIAPAGLRSGVTLITDTDAGDNFVRMVGSGATTKQIGLVGTAPDDTALLDSQALSGTTSVLSNSKFGTVTKVLHGDLENSVTVTLTASTSYVPSADNTDGSAPFPINGAAMFQVAGGKNLSFVRADSGVTADVHISAWKYRAAAQT